MKTSFKHGLVVVGKKVAMQFFRVTGDERVALADPSYKQHNPAFKRRAEEAKISDYQEFKNAFSSAVLAARQGGPGGVGRGPGAGPAAAARQPVRGRHGRVRHRDDHSQEQPARPDGRREIL